MSDPIDQHPRHPAWALWTVFAGLHRWLLAKGPPPSIGHERFWGRALRTSVLLGGLGAASSAASTLWFAVEKGLGAWMPGEAGMVFWPGFCFGALVLVPVSRWQGRWWITTLLAVPVSMGLYWSAVMVFVSRSMPQTYWAEAAWPSGFIAGVAGGIGIGLWMRPPLSGRNCAQCVACGLAGAVGGVLFAILLSSLDRAHWPLPLPDVVLAIIAWTALFTPFHCLVAMALGSRWWWVTQAPFPAANTADTSTAKPFNSADVARSPLRNSP